MGDTFAIPPITSNEHPSGVYVVPEQTVDDHLDQVVAALRRVTGHSLEASLEAGELIFQHVFAGDEALLRARGKKCSSFRKLAAHPDLIMSTSSLWRAVAIYELSRRFPEITHYVHTGVGHISVVLGLPAADQYTLLRRAEAERWTRRRLQKIVTERRVAQRGASVPVSRVADRLAGLELLVHDASMDRQLIHLSQLEAHQALGALARIRQRCNEVENKLRLGACY